MSWAAVPCCRTGAGLSTELFSAPEQAAQASSAFGGSVPNSPDSTKLSSETHTHTSSKQQRQARHYDSGTKDGQWDDLCYLKPSL